MENSEVQQAVFKMGELLVNKLGPEPSVDTLGRWMAHYIAEQMMKATNLEGIDKENAEKACFDNILNLWQHRWSLPSGTRPFEDFEPILRLIEKLNPERERTFYYHQLPNNGRDRQNNENTNEWIKAAEQIDKAARICIAYALDQLATGAKTEETEQWLKNSNSLASEADTQIIQKLVNNNCIIPEASDDLEFTPAAISDFSNHYEYEMVQSRIEHLEEFSLLSEKMLSRLKIKLEDLSKNL